MERITAVLTLGEEPNEYIFIIDRRQDPPNLCIPGTFRGPDNCTPDKPEQERWLDSLVETVTREWDCRWKFTSGRACDEFVESLRKHGESSSNSFK